MRLKPILLVAAILTLTLVVVLAVKHLTTPQQLTVAEMTKQIEQSYNAEVITLVEKSEHFVASFKQDGSIFEVSIDDETGQLSKLVLIQQNSAPSADNKPEQQPSQPQTPTVLTKQQAIDIALKEVSGEIDSVDFENTSDGGYYFVEVEQEHQEITIQIHAITGKILSIQSDD